MRYPTKATTIEEAKRRIKELLKLGWTKGAYFRDSKGTECLSGDASCFCLSGAMWAAELDPKIDNELSRRITNVIEAKHRFATIPAYNDYVANSVDQVLDVLEAA